MSDNVFKIRDSAPMYMKRPVAAVQAAPRQDEVELSGAPEGETPENAQIYTREAVMDQSPMQGEIIQGAMTEASRILEEAVRTAEASRAEIMAKAQYEANKLQNEAAEQGRRQGFSSVVGEMHEVAGNLEAAIARFEGERAGYEAEFDEQLKWLAIEIASKVLAKKVSLDDGEMLEMVDKAVKGVQNEPWIRVEVAQEMTHLINRLTDLYEGFEKIDVNAVPSAPGTVHIETPSGIIDASLKTQLANLKTYFEKAEAFTER